MSKNVKRCRVSHSLGPLSFSLPIYQFSCCNRPHPPPILFIIIIILFWIPPPSLSFPFFSFGNNFLNVFFIGNVMLASRMVRSSSFFIVSSLVCDFSSGCSVVGWICRFRSNTSFSFHTCNFSVSVFLLSLWVAFVAFWPPLRLQRSATSTAVDRRPLRWQ